MDLCTLRWQDPATQTYLGSPSLVRLPDGRLLATHDYFGPGCPRNHEDEEHLTSVYRSADDGRTWHNLTHLANAYWSTLFVHGGDVYLLGCSQQYGSVVIRRSTDGGATWTHPRDAHTGLLFRGGPWHTAPNYHGAPVPVLVHGGRLFRAIEDCDPCTWGSGFRAAVISAPVDADLLASASWTMSNQLAFDPAWVPASWPRPTCPGWLEGNCVATPDGRVVNLLRMNSEPAGDYAACMEVHDAGRRVSFNPASGFIPFPGGMTKFTMRHDPVSGRYLAFTNPRLTPGVSHQRNVLVLCSSPDLQHWQSHRMELRDDSPLSAADSLRLTGFQYVDWQFDGADLIYLVRTAYDGAHNFHDSNRITFHRLSDFRHALREQV